MTTAPRPVVRLMSGGIVTVEDLIACADILTDAERQEVDRAWLATLIRTTAPQLTVPDPPASALESRTGSPVTSWAAVAEACSVTISTLLRRRQAKGKVGQKPYFPSPEAARSWFAALVAQPERPARRMPRSAGPAEAATEADVSAALAALRRV